MTKKIIRFFREENHPNEVIETGLTPEEARAYCNDPETSSDTAIFMDAYTAAHGEWFDGMEEE